MRSFIHVLGALIAVVALAIASPALAAKGGGGNGGGGGGGSSDPVFDTYCLQGLALPGDAAPDSHPPFIILGITLRTDALEGQPCLDPAGNSWGTGGNEGGGKGGKKK
jgi:hypothetical protein